MNDLFADLEAREKLFADTPEQEIKYWFEYSGPLQVSREQIFFLSLLHCWKGRGVTPFAHETVPHTMEITIFDHQNPYPIQPLASFIRSVSNF